MTLIEAIELVSATSAKHTEPATGMQLVKQVERHVQAEHDLGEMLHATFGADELYRLLRVLVEMHQDTLRHGTETLEEFLMFADPDGF